MKTLLPNKLWSPYIPNMITPHIEDLSLSWEEWCEEEDRKAVILERYSKNPINPKYYQEILLKI